MTNTREPNFSSLQAHTIFEFKMPVVHSHFYAKPGEHKHSASAEGEFADGRELGYGLVSCQRSQPSSVRTVNHANKRHVVACGGRT